MQTTEKTGIRLHRITNFHGFNICFEPIISISNGTKHSAYLVISYDDVYTKHNEEILMTLCFKCDIPYEGGHGGSLVLHTPRHQCEVFEVRLYTDAKDKSSNPPYVQAINTESVRQWLLEYLNNNAAKIISHNNQGA